jgi:hypothetical protein
MQKRFTTGDAQHRLAGLSQLRIFEFARDDDEAERCAVSAGGCDRVVLTLRANALGRRHTVSLTAREARRLAANLLAQAGAVDGSTGD